MFLLLARFCVYAKLTGFSHVCVVVDVHVGGTGKLVRLVLESRILVRQLNPLLSQGVAYRLVLRQRDPE